MKKRIVIYFLLILPAVQLFGITELPPLPDTISQNEITDTLDADKTITLVDEIGKDKPELKNLVSFPKIFWTLLVILAGYIIIRFVSRSIEIWSEKSPERRIRGKAIVPLVKIFSWMVIVYFIVRGVFQPPIESLIAFGATVGVAVGFAAQDILKNIFGGFVILLDRPFKVGDKIEVGGVYGEVLDMSLRSTRIQTADDSLVTLPNGELMNQSISNANSGETNCQVVAEIYLPITIDTEKVRKIAIETAKVAKYIYVSKPIAVLFFNEIKHEKLCYKMRLKAYVMDIRYEFAFKSEMTESVMRELLKEGILTKDNSI
jgi:small-conductance mechanosensitive channel